MGGSFGDLLKKAGLEESEATAAPAPDQGVEDEEEPLVYGPKLVVRFTRKGHGGKTVTEVRGIVSGHRAVLGRLKRELGSGGRVVDDALVLQGHQVERVARWLESQGVRRVVRS